MCGGTLRDWNGGGWKPRSCVFSEQVLERRVVQLMVRRRRGRKRALGTRTPMTLPIKINQRWSLDFVSDTLSDGRRFRILCIVDDFSRECLAAVVDTSLGGVRVVRELERLTIERATPETVVSDNGTELTSGAVLRWATRRVAWCVGKMLSWGMLWPRMYRLPKECFDARSINGFCATRGIWWADA